MATITASWTENVTLHTSGSVSAGASATDDIDLAIAGYDCVEVQVRITFGSTPDDGCDVEVFASPDSGTTDDTIPLFAFQVQEVTSTQVIKSFVVRDVPYIAVKLTNNDSTDAVTYEADYAGRKWSSA